MAPEIVMNVIVISTFVVTNFIDMASPAKHLGFIRRRLVHLHVQKRASSVAGRKLTNH